MEKLRDILVTDRTQTDVLARNEKGTYNAEDLNRVLRAASWLAGKLEGYGYSVAQEYFPAVLVSVRADPPEGGTVRSALCYQGETAAVTARASDGFEFLRWEESGEAIGTSPEYSFTADRDRVLTAVFQALSDTTRFIPAGESEALLTADGQEFLVAR